MVIKSPKYSFVNFNTAIAGTTCCDGDNTDVLPIIEESDIAFQFYIETLNATQAAELMITDLNNIHLVLINESGLEIHNWFVSNVLKFERYRTGLTKVTFVWKNDLIDIKTLVNCDECFSFRIKAAVFVNNQTINLTADSNKFYRKCKSCHTSVIEYNNENDYAEFNYCNVPNFANKARLSMELLSPKPIEDKAAYRKSNGKIRQTKSIITKEYKGETEFYTENTHDKITVALGHDLVLVEGEIYTGEISKTGEYDIEWEKNLCKAPATFKVQSSPFAIKNNNCADCADPNSMVIACPLVTGLQANVVDNGNGTITITFTWSPISSIVPTFHVAAYIAPAVSGAPAFGGDVPSNQPYIVTVATGIYNVGFWSSNNPGVCSNNGPVFLNNIQ